MPQKKRKLLIADPSTMLIDAILTSKEASQYDIATAKTGPAALKKIQEFEPDLLMIDLIMPHIHGIEVMKTIKTNARYREMGIIVSSYHVMIQNYHAAIEEGANYFLTKPFEIPDFFKLVERFFEGNLTPEQFSLKSEHEIVQNHCYHPIPSTLSS